MKTYCFIILLFLSFNLHSEESALSMVKKSEAHIKGESFSGESTMTVYKDSSTRTLTMKVWTKGQDNALVKISSPAKEKGVGNLRLSLNFWQYLPNINKIIKIPPSLMLQSWMGSDFTNDDLVRGSSLSRDYDHKFLAKEMIGETDSVKILCTPKPNAPVVWGKIELWLRKIDSSPIQQFFYSENGELLKKMSGEKFETFGKHTIPTKVTMSDARNDKHKTLIEYNSSTIKFDELLSDDVFTQNNLKK
jgi:outer membrane lipoprotein-sorting protein